MIERPLVLVVDDDDDVRALAVDVLTSAGMEAVGVASGVDALAWIEDASRLPEAIVLDVQMPEMDGWTTLERLREGARAAHVPVVLCTVKSRPEDRDRGREVGAERYLAKPFSIGQLEQMVRVVLRDGVTCGEVSRP